MGTFTKVPGGPGPSFLDVLLVTRVKVPMHIPQTNEKNPKLVCVRLLFFFEKKSGGAWVFLGCRALQLNYVLLLPFSPKATTTQRSDKMIEAKRKGKMNLSLLGPQLNRYGIMGVIIISQCCNFC